MAVIGTGASALQFIPHLAEEAGRLAVFQRTPPWLIPRPTSSSCSGPDPADFEFL